MFSCAPITKTPDSFSSIFNLEQQSLNKLMITKLKVGFGAPYLYSIHLSDSRVLASLYIVDIMHLSMLSRCGGWGEAGYRVGI